MIITRTDRRGGVRAAIVALVLMAAAAGPARAQDTATYFRQNCTSCHTIGGGRLVGPDLKDVTGRRDRGWLQSFILDPKAKIDAGDPYALSLLEQAKGVVMPPPPGITPERAGMLLDMIDAESALEASQFRGQQVSAAPFTAVDVARGAALFSGSLRLRNGGPACVSCHSAAGVGGLGGGQLGPDLMRVYERLQGRTGLSAWLAAPGTPTMRSVFGNRPLDPSEVPALVAYFEKQSQAGTRRPLASQFNFLLFGLGGAVLGLVALDLAWKGRLRGVRRPMTRGGSPRGMS